MYYIPYLFNHVYIFIGCIDFSSWLGLACITLFLIFTVHSYVAPTLNKKIIIIIFIINADKQGKLNFLCYSIYGLGWKSAFISGFPNIFYNVIGIN